MRESQSKYKQRFLASGFKLIHELPITYLQKLLARALVVNGIVKTE